VPRRGLFDAAVKPAKSSTTGPLAPLQPPGLYAALRTAGAIAQLGERLNGIQEVRGSTPLGSTKRNQIVVAHLIVY
jgi:hypothetical protein